VAALVGTPTLASASWSTPVSAAPCSASGAPSLVFPTDAPDQPTGPGALVWSAAAGCSGGAGARVQEIGPADQLLAATVPTTAHATSLQALGVLTAAAAPHGELLIAGLEPDSQDTLFLQGAAGGPFAPQQRPDPSGAPVALATGYLGDLAAVYTAARDGHETLQVAFERHSAYALGAPVSLDTGSGSLGEVTATLDYRSDVLLAWVQRGSVYACRVTNERVAGPIQRLGPAGRLTRIASLLSDDDRAIVMWSTRRGSLTSVYLDQSTPGPLFRPARLLESFSSTSVLPPRLVRLGDEGVVAAWTGYDAGRLVVRSAPIDEHGLLEITTTADPPGDALLASLAAGPFDEVFVLFTDPPGAAERPGWSVDSLLAAHGLVTRPGAVALGTPEVLASDMPVSDVTAAVDPATDRAVAAWIGRADRIRYSAQDAGSEP
jgi:hypothetical protein